MVQRLALVAGALFVLCPPMSPGDDGIAIDLYGKGVYAFFQGDFVKAHELLTESLSAGSQDPRVYYFRGLAYSKLGRDEEAESDFAKAAALESSDIDRLYNISKSLERVQGADRMKIEKHRVKARLAAYQKAEQLRRARYEELRREESRVLEQQSKAAGVPPAKGLPVAPDVSFGEPPAQKPLAKPAVGATTAPADKAESKPGEPAAAPAEAVEMVPSAPDAAGGVDPFAPSPVAEKKPATKPAAAETGTAAPKKKAAAKAAADDSDPFAAPADEKKAPAKQPGAKPAADDSDPFAAPGDAGMAAPAAKKSGAKPAADDSDPFAAPADEKKAPAKKPGAKPAADDSDPFAAEPTTPKKGTSKSSTKKSAKPQPANVDADPFATDAPPKN